MEIKTITLYRPVGPQELALIEQSDMCKFPPRLPEQPIFYPVENEKYACEIAEHWNVRDSKKGFVTRFEIDAEYLSRFSLQKVGASHHLEYWIPAEELNEFNNHLIGKIEVIKSYGL